MVCQQLGEPFISILLFLTAVDIQCYSVSVSGAQTVLHFTECVAGSAPHLFTRSPLGPTSLFPLGRFLSYFVHSVPRVSEITWDSTLSDWLISLREMFPRSIHAVVNDEISLLFRAKHYCVV